MRLFQGPLDTCLDGPLLCQPRSRFALHCLRAFECQKPERGHIRQNHPFTKLPFWETDFLPLLVLARWGVVPVKISLVIIFLRKYQRITQNYYQYWCLFFGEISALQYCTGNFLAPPLRVLSMRSRHPSPNVKNPLRVRAAFWLKVITSRDAKP